MTTLHSLRSYSSSTASMTSGRSDAKARDRASSCNESSMRTSNFDKRASTDGPVSAPLDAVGDRMMVTGRNDVFAPHTAGRASDLIRAASPKRNKESSPLATLNM